MTMTPKTPAVRVPRLPAAGRLHRHSLQLQLSKTRNEVRALSDRVDALNRRLVALEGRQAWAR
jgi:hypothetical protein